MSHLLQKQRTPFTPNEKIEREWLLIDAKGQRLGRMASSIAFRLRGKHRPDYAPHQNIGDCIVVVNARYVALTGKKREQKIYYQHSNYTGGLKQIVLNQMLQKDATKVVKLAVKRMLPSGPLGRSLLKNLYVYPEAAQPHSAQKVKAFALA